MCVKERQEVVMCAKERVVWGGIDMFFPEL